MNMCIGILLELRIKIQFLLFYSSIYQFFFYLFHKINYTPLLIFDDFTGLCFTINCRHNFVIN